MGLKNLIKPGWCRRVLSPPGGRKTHCIRDVIKSHVTVRKWLPQKWKNQKHVTFLILTRPLSFSLSPKSTASGFSRVWAHAHQVTCESYTQVCCWLMTVNASMSNTQATIKHPNSCHHEEFTVTSERGRTEIWQAWENINNTSESVKVPVMMRHNNLLVGGASTGL